MKRQNASIRPYTRQGIIKTIMNKLQRKKKSLTVGESDLLDWLHTLHKSTFLSNRTKDFILDRLFLESETARKVITKTLLTRPKHPHKAA